MDSQSSLSHKLQTSVSHSKQSSKQFSIKSERRIKTIQTESSKSIDTNKILNNFYDQCKKRQLTSRFMHFRENSSQQQDSVLENIESCPNTFRHNTTAQNSPVSKYSLFSNCDKILTTKSNGSKRVQTKYAQQYIMSEINDNNRIDMLQKMEQFILNHLTEECKEMADFFQSFMQQLRFQLIEQQSDLLISEKQMEIEKMNEIIRMNQTHTYTSQDMEKQLNYASQEKLLLKNKQKELESDIQDQKLRNQQLKKEIEMKQNEILLKNRKIKEQGYEILTIQRKLEYFENKGIIDKRQSRLIRNSISQNQSNSLTSLNQFGNNSQQHKFSHIIDPIEEASSPTITELEDEEEKELNQIEFNPERLVEIREKEIQVEQDLIPYYTKEQDSQTQLQLIDKKYNDLTQDICNQAITFMDFLTLPTEKFEVEQNIKLLIDTNDFQKKSEEDIQQLFDQHSQVIEQQTTDKALMRQQSIRGNVKRTSIIEKSNTLIPQHVSNIKMKSMVTFIKLQGSKMKQLENELNEKLQKIEQMQIENTQLLNNNNILKESNLKLQEQIQVLNTKISDLENQIMSDAMDMNQVLQQPEKKVSKTKQYTFAKRKNGKAAPHLGQKVTISYDFQKNQSKILIERIKQKPMNKFSNYLPMKLVLKMISTFYFDKITGQKENKQLRDQDMGAFIYNYYLQQFGYTKVTEQKFLILTLSIKKYLQIVRVNIFAKFMNLLDEKCNYRVEEQQRYLEALEYVSNIQNLGTTIKDNEQEQKNYIPYVRALAYLGQLQNFNFSQEELNYLKQDLENLKENDPKNINKAGIVDFDLLMIRVLTIFRNNVEKTKLYVINAFASCDLDGNGMCNIDEWLLLIRHIEPDKFDEDKFAEIFEEYADLWVEEEKNLSFDRFSILSMENELFSDAQQNKFLKVKNNHDAETKFEELKQNWSEQYANQLKRLNSINMDESDKNKWLKILDVLDSKITKDSTSRKPLLIAYKIFLDESN